MAYQIVKTKLKNGKSIKISISKHEIKYILNEVIGRDCYFPKINGIDFDIKNSDTVIDIGGNIGVFTLYAAALALKGRIYSFEPVKNNFKRLRENVERNNFKNVTLENVAVSGKAGKVEMYLEKSNTGGHSIHKEKYMDPKTIRSTEWVEAITLQDVFDKYTIKKCDFLKIDCEGDEWNILKNLPPKYFEKIEKIALEFHPNVDEIEISRYLIKQGFRVTIHDLDGILGMIFACK